MTYTKRAYTSICGCIELGGGNLFWSLIAIIGGALLGCSFPDGRLSVQISHSLPWAAISARSGPSRWRRNAFTSHRDALQLPTEWQGP
jgi:hypothetical protein